MFSFWNNMIICFSGYKIGFSLQYSENNASLKLICISFTMKIEYYSQYSFMHYTKNLDPYL